MLLVGLNHRVDATGFSVLFVGIELGGTTMAKELMPTN